MFTVKRKEITSVFTPRQTYVNPAMYVARPDLEKLLLRSVRRNTHSLLFGESGNGKSWLYRHTLEKNDIPFVVANSANASRLGSITVEICNALIEPGTVKKYGFSEDKAAELSVLIAKANLTHSANYQIVQEDPLLEAFRIFGSHSSGRKILILDNLESIFCSDRLMNELADIVILLDDPRYSQFGINLLIVGIPNGVLEYFRKTKNAESVANRVEEIEKVGSLDKSQVGEVVKKGFDQLKVVLTSSVLDALSNHIWNITLGIAQRVHEYCECLAYGLEEQDWKFTKLALDKADTAWLKQGLRQSYQVVEGHLNSRQTAVSRRNQVIYCIGKTRAHQFDSNVIDGMIRKEFPETIPDTNMGIGSILTELCSEDSPLICRNEKTNSFSVIDPRYLMCIRLILYREPGTNRVLKKQFIR